MGIFSRITRRVKKLVKKNIRRLKKTVPIYIPVHEGNLLDGRTALISGGTSGIGLAIAEAFLRNGAFVVITGRSREKAVYIAESIESKDRRFRGRIFGAGLDILRPETFQEKIAEIAQMLPEHRIDILVNSAGVNPKEGGRNMFGTASQEIFDIVMQTNLRGTFFLSEVVARQMISGKIRGNILNIASSSSLRPAATAYTLSKWGVRGLTAGLAKTLIPHGIVVNGLAPGPTYTPMHVDENVMGGGIDEYASPCGRMATPEEIANMSAVLASDMGRMIVGDTVYMTGGAGIITYDDIAYDMGGE